MEKNIKNTLRFLVYLYSFDGELVTNLKLQKILYYIYVWFLIKHKGGKVCFKEKFQAWPIGPVLYSAYDLLKKFGSRPIDANFSKITNDRDLEKLKKELGTDLINIIEEVYKRYCTKSAFDLVNLTHNELAWRNARKGLRDSDPSSRILSDKDILAQYVK